ncbi:peptidase S41-like protein [Paenibacillus cellulosilyticus]|uniref:Peptidase S41-like protein n=1 Tax=Paenibacillus cellulosilyticus TaxID=375489 RepID=A0A2V2YTI1_9BACL|nr:S41 family peptidase [Paenibacillus cellulosilyticus]PWW02764.1 peptidase S41-like protein [Paenibacillus cellulosilyticus]QKS45686.1 S41 family peptidase [Paenibacillus cellulosilyticus]
MTSINLNDVFIANTVESLGALLLDYYIFPNTAEIMKNSLLEKLSRGDYDKDESGFTLAKKITEDLQEISNDKHLAFSFSEAILPLQQHDPINNEDLLLRQKRNNYGFERVERLPGNIGYLIINEFAYPEHAGSTATHAMSFIAGTDGLIIDLRNNYGGSSFMSAFIASYLLDGSPPVHLNDIYWRQYDTTQSFWSLPHVPGERFGADKPVYILTSQHTGSCAEEFAYSLQAIQRVTIIGEKTGGKANAGSVHRVNDHFQAFIPNAYPINPITKGSWNNIGVLPDIACNSRESFDKAYHLLLEQLLQQFSESMEPGREQIIAEIRKMLEL